MHRYRSRMATKVRARYGMSCVVSSVASPFSERQAGAVPSESKETAGKFSLLAGHSSVWVSPSQRHPVAIAPTIGTILVRKRFTGR